MSSSEPAGFVWTGRYDYLEIDEWWCPTEADWVPCPGPCPDGSLHERHRSNAMRVKQYRALGAAAT